MLKKYIKLFLQKFSRVIYYLIPQEFKNQNKEVYGIINLLNEKKDKETFEKFSDKIIQSVPFIGHNSKIRQYAIELAISNQNNISENLYYLEFGVFTGKSTNLFSKYVQKLYAFDSFEGLREDWLGMEAKGSYNLNKKIPKLNPNVHTVVGWVEDTLDPFLEKHKPKINFVHMDLDLYNPTKFTLEKIKPFLIHNSIIIFDELYNYINWEEGEFKALSEVFSHEEYKYKAFRLNGCQVVIEIKKINFNNN